MTLAPDPDLDAELTHEAQLNRLNRFAAEFRQQRHRQQPIDRVKTRPLLDEPEPPRLRPMKLYDFVHAVFPAREFVLDPILPAGGIAMVVGQRGVAKTMLATGISHAVASAGEFLRWRAPKKRRVLHIDGEMPASLLQERFRLLGTAWDTLDVLSLDAQELGVSLNLADPENQRELEPLLDGVEQLTLDNMSTLCIGGPENDAESWNSMQSWLLHLRRRNVSVLLVHHAGRNDNPRGTSKREDILDTVLHLRRPDDYDPEDGCRFIASITKGRGIFGDAASPFEAVLDASTGTAVWTVTDVRDQEAAEVAELTAAGKSIRDIAEALGMSKSRVHRLQKRIAREAGRHPQCHRRNHTGRCTSLLRRLRLRTRTMRIRPR